MPCGVSYPRDCMVAVSIDEQRRYVEEFAACDPVVAVASVYIPRRKRCGERSHAVRIDCSVSYEAVDDGVNHPIRGANQAMITFRFETSSESSPSSQSVTTMIGWV